MFFNTDAPDTFWCQAVTDRDLRRPGFMSCLKATITVHTVPVPTYSGVLLKVK